MNKTFSPKIVEVKRDWHLLDASDKVIGRLSTEAVILLMGKHKPSFARHVDCGDHVVVINAKKVQASGNKELQKVYHHHTGYPGGMKEITLEKLRASKPERIIEHSVSGMLPKNKLHDPILKRLHIYPEDTHPYGQHFK